MFVTTFHALIVLFPIVDEGESAGDATAAATVLLAMGCVEREREGNMDFEYMITCIMNGEPGLELNDSFFLIWLLIQYIFGFTLNISGLFFIKK